MRQERDIVDVLTSFISRQRFEDIPERVQALAKIHIIDCVGVMLAGAAVPEVRALHRRLFGLERSNVVDVLGSEENWDASLVAFGNAFSARVLDYDDVQTTETSTYGLLTNPTAPVLAATLAAGRQRNVSGQTLLSAYLAGVEIAAQLAASVDPKSLRNGLAATASFGAIGALMAAAKLMALQRKEIRSALAIWDTTTARHRSAGDSTLTTALRDAHSVRMAVEAAMIASEGMAVEGPAESAVLSTISAPALAKRLAKPYYILEPGFAIRTYPSSVLSHPACDLVLAIVNLNNLQAADIDKIDVEITQVMAQMLSLGIPTSVTDLRRNLPFGVALAACKGAIAPENFSRLPRQKDIQALMQRISCRSDPELDSHGYERARTVVHVTLTSGRIIQMKADVAKGTPQKPLSEIELSHKFLQCALSSIDQSQAEELLNRLWALEAAPSLSDLLRVDATSSEGPVHTPHEHAHNGGG